MNTVVDQIEDPQYRAVAKQIVKKSGAGLYGKAGSGLTGRGLSGSGMRNRRRMPDFDEEGMGKMRILPERGRNVIQPYPPRMPRVDEDYYMKSIRKNKQGSGFFSNIGKSLKKEANKGKTALFGKRIGDEASFVLPIAGTVMGGAAGSFVGGPFGSALEIGRAHV